MLTIGIYGPKDRLLDNGKPSFMSHDHNITFMRNGKVIDAIELERYTRVKHDNRLDEYIEEIIQLVWDKQEQIRFVLANSFVSKGFRSLQGNIVIDEPEKFEIKDIAVSTSGSFVYNGTSVDAEFYIITHEFAHIATTLPFFQTFQDNSLLFHLDGGASNSNHSLWLYKNREIKLLDFGWETLKKPLNIFNDNVVSAWILEMELSDHLAIPGKLMGFASWGTLDKNLYHWLKINNWFIDYKGTKNEFLTLLHNFTNDSSITLSLKDETCQNIAACFQHFFTESIYSYLEGAQKKYNVEYLHYSGGAALNIVTNSKIENELGFTNVMIPPAPSDCGLSLGAASYVEWKDSIIQQHSPFLNSIGLSEKEGNFDVEKIVMKIVEGKVTTLSFGLAEFGPRALGHRSIIARPDSITLRVKVSEEIKKREWYRPVAPIILEEIANEALVEYKTNSQLSKYMLGCWKVKDEWKDKFKGVIHSDGTVRAQVICGDLDYYSEIYELLTKLWDKHDIAGIINTSLNVKGEPILHKTNKPHELFSTL